MFDVYDDFDFSLENDFIDPKIIRKLGGSNFEKFSKKKSRGVIGSKEKIKEARRAKEREKNQAFKPEF